MPVPLMLVTSKELELRGSFRFHEEFATAVAAMQAGRIDVAPLITHAVGLEDAEQAFTVASDRSAAVKTQIHFAQ
jgi:L-idonate 5-dehydrogenase